MNGPIVGETGVSRAGPRALRGLGSLARALASAFAAAAPLLFAPTPARAHVAQSNQYLLYPADDNAGGSDGLTSTGFELGDAIGEAVAGPRMFSPAAYQLGSGLRQIIAYPNVVTLVLSTANPEGATFDWTSPGYDGALGSLMPGTSFFIVIASYTVPDPFFPQNYTLAIATSGQAPGTPARVSTGNLPTSTTYYVQVWTLDADGNVSFNSPTSTFTTLADLVTQIKAMNAAGGLKRALLSWTHPGRNSRLAFYRILRSADPNGPFTQVSTTTELAATDRNLLAFSTYYYKVQAQLASGLLGTPSVAVSAAPFTYKPLEPLGFKVIGGPGTAALAWSTTTRFSDSTPFDNPGNPGFDELQGYGVYRSTDPCAAPVFLASATASSLTDATGGQNYYYSVQSYNVLGPSSSTALIDSLGLAYFGTDDCHTRAVITAAQVDSLRAQNNRYGKDIQLSRRRRPQDVGGKVLQAAEFRAMLDGAVEIKDFRLNQPVTIEMRYDTQGGSPVPSTAAVPTAFASPAATQKELGIFWDNGIEYKKLYGKIDAQNQIVSVQSLNLGKYQLRSMYRDESGATFDVSNLSSRVITPNGDGLNDVLIVNFDNPTHATVRGRIYDTSGRRVADMTPSSVPNVLTWDGTMNGKKVTSGVYLYEIDAPGRRYSGTVVAAR